MLDQIVESSKAKMGALEALVKGLPGIRGYVDKELRRSTDKRLREQLADYLQAERVKLLQIQRQLLEQYGLKWVAKVEPNVQRLQTTIDRIRSASYGYAGFFSDVRIGEEQLDALYKFDQSLAQEVTAIGSAIEQLAIATEESALTAALDHLITAISTVDKRFGERSRAIEAPGLLLSENGHSLLTTGEQWENTVGQ